MKKLIKDAVEEYQCPGCVSGYNTSCYKKDEYSNSCKEHLAGTILFPSGTVFLGMPKGFNRTGELKTKIRIFEKFDEAGYDFFNVPVWKYLNENNHTLVRGISPRINLPFLDIILENCIDKINCIEVTQKDLDRMD
jgi:hypothetical protein